MQPGELKQFVSDLLSLLDVSVDGIEVTTGHRTVVAVSSPDSARLIGQDGDHLRALNSIARRLAEAKHGEDAASFLIDVNGFHEAQMERVRDNARLLAQRTRLFKHDVEMGPMSAYERLVVHELFAEDPEITTESQGEGKFRHIVLKHKAA
ncbi:MAG TPA: R3H domain-containing nucleic acid-binding protein [Candidatus Paceibacterota bacterium]|nr:R3H domain-containing nucleic acid-binding protein [Candidatus Paceibacterota bacterium]